ncbi:hypothetical protein PC110_g9827 [Phytophthora cactorum]|uniref:Uncharacterized protein n=1 Tax=Phytophthora cactorum TaxID=29920 RepID=A0A329SCW2_9STRA|nr:hypothetical protein PC110_g9827 [Phytophthora cactorum]
MGNNEEDAFHGFTEETLFGDLDQFEACLYWLHSESDDDEGKRNPGGSKPGKRLNKRRDFKKHYNDHAAQYFCDDPIYDERDFRRRFRMPKSLFWRVFNAVASADPYFEHRRDATGKWGIQPLVKVIAALRVLANALPADAIDEIFGMAESTVCETIHHFADALDRQFSGQYLRQPNEEDVQRLVQRNAERGFIGMLFSIDCMHWEWKSCPRKNIKICC